ncbi:PDZ domain-containing protein MAGIX isoform X2 [Carettochelys insculpta]|uniref:PDZ domain-containing protein MAGIX isoform X2 n=1 Tax=Carettochelys insculpta TaxID=44489 RepID=UPI003EBC2961
MGGAGPQLQHWGAEQSEACGISCGTHQSPHRAPEPSVPGAMAPAAGVNVVVVVDGSCILQYTHRDCPCRCLCHEDATLAHRPPPSYGAAASHSPPSARPPLSRRARGLGVRCCAEFCLGEEEERAERRAGHQGLPLCAPPPGRLTPVPLPRSATGPCFAVEVPEDGGPGVQVARIWDRERCPLLEEGDLVAKVNGADVRGLGPQEVENVLQEHMRAGDVILLVERRAPGLRRPPLEPAFSIPSPCRDPPRAEGQGGAQGSCGGPGGDTLAITSFVGPEPLDLLLCPARCLQGEAQRPQQPPPAGGPQELGGSEAGRLGPRPSRDPPGGKHEEAGGLQAELEGLFRQARAKLRLLPPTRGSAASTHLDAADLEVDEGAGRPGCRLPQPQVSDQLVAINGEPTLGMTHARAVEQIRRGGSRIRLVLRKGNGFVPDYDREHIPSPAGQDQMPEDGPAPHSLRAKPAEESPGCVQDNGGHLEASPSSAKRGSHRSHQRGSQDHCVPEQGWPALGKGVETGQGGSVSLSPQRQHVWRGLSDPVPGPWLVPSKERLSRALRGICMGDGEHEEGGSLEQGKGGEMKRRT